MIYLIDFENVHEEGFTSIEKLGDKDAVYCFFTKNVAKISMSALAGMRSGQLHFVEAESGKQSLDLALVSFLGYLIGTKPQEQYFEIISNDNGFNKVAEFWNKRGNNLRVRIRKTSDQRSKGETAKATASAKRNNGKSAASEMNSAQSAPQPAAKSTDSTPDARESSIPPQSGEAGEKTDVQASASPVINNPIEGKTADSSVNSLLLAAGISQQAADYLLAQVDKYRDDKNVKQLVYRAVVKKFGQKTGTQIYNSAKKIMLK